MTEIEDTVIIPKNEMEMFRHKIMYLRSKLTEWYKKNKRNYPWRMIKDPYKILIAEIMLRRTRADQVLPIYEKFIEKYPTIDSLSKSKLE